jgi:alkylation response protein AidB-like acyl-CoA dehydrogenase
MKMADEPLGESRLSRDEVLRRVADAQPVLTHYAQWAEEHGRLHEQAYRALVDIGVPRLYLPRGLGGEEVDPVTCALVCEAIADADAAAAWHVMVFNAARFMAASWPAELAAELWLDSPDALVAASGNTPFTAVREADEYVVDGVNRFVSGCHHAEWLMSPVMVDGAPHTALLPMAQCEIIDNWDNSGLRGSGSNDVRAAAVRVPARHVLPVREPGAPANRHYSGTLYKCPSRVVFATYVPVAFSLARRGLDALSELAENKVPYATDTKLGGRSVAQVHFGKALAEYRAARLFFYDELDKAWEAAKAGLTYGAGEKAGFYLAGTHAVQACALVLEHVAIAAGSSAVDRACPFDRLLRDVQTLRHHGFVNESRYGSVAQVFWGAELDYPPILR